MSSEAVRGLLPKTAVPIIAVGSVEDTRKYYVETLGFNHVRGVVGKDGQLDIRAVAEDGARIMFARTPAMSSSTAPDAAKQPVAIYLEVEDVGHYFEQIRKKEGVNVTDQLTMQWWGIRSFKVMDPHGYEIWFYQIAGDPEPPEGTELA